MKPSKPVALASVRHLRVGDVLAAAQLATQATKGIIDITEGVHQSVLRTSGVGGKPGEGRAGRTGGVTGLVYRSVRATTHLVGRGLDLVLEKFLPLANPAQHDSAEREAVLSALNGVLGDHLAKTGNSLALPMQLRHAGQPLPLGQDVASPLLSLPARAAMPHVVVLIHGLCMNDRQWLHNGHDHGAFLAHALGATPLYLRYNSGLHVSDNGAQLAVFLEQLVAQWPAPLKTLTLVGHSMGGLVARSAHHAATAGLAAFTWPTRLKSLVFLGSPHHGAPLERAGSWVDEVLGHAPWVSRFTAPFAKLGHVRSAGITDLRYGHLLATDWQGHEKYRRACDNRTAVPLPAGVESFTVAATLAPKRSVLAERLTGDGLVPLNSALGFHDDPKRKLAFPRDHQLVVHRTGHLALLGSPVVAHQLAAWLLPAALA